MPISCQLYDQLEIAAMHQKTVKICTEDALEKHVKIANLIARNGIEYLVTTDGETFDLESLQSFEVLDQ